MRPTRIISLQMHVTKVSKPKYVNKISKFIVWSICLELQMSIQWRAWNKWPEKKFQKIPKKKKKNESWIEKTMKFKVLVSQNQCHSQFPPRGALKTLNPLQNLHVYLKLYAITLTIYKLTPNYYLSHFLNYQPLQLNN